MTRGASVMRQHAMALSATLEQKVGIIAELTAQRQFLEDALDEKARESREEVLQRQGQRGQGAGASAAAEERPRPMAIDVTDTRAAARRVALLENFIEKCAGCDQGIVSSTSVGKCVFCGKKGRIGNGRLWTCKGSKHDACIGCRLSRMHERMRLYIDSI